MPEGARERALRLLARGLRDRTFAAQLAQRALGFARAVPLFWGCERGRRLCATGPMRVANRGRVVLGDRVTFFGGMIPSEIVCHPGALLEIGEESTFNYGVSIEAAESVRIGPRCMVASMVRIADAGGPWRRGPVVIGADVWLAHGALVEPGVSVGDGSVIAAGAVVSCDVPPGVLAIGNPARWMRLEMAGRKRAG